MLAMGSELGFSQSGNNNAYAQDNATSAIDWRSADKKLARFHRAASLRVAPRPSGALARRLPDRAALRRVGSSRRRMARRRGADVPVARWGDQAGAVMVAVFATPVEGGVDRAAIAMNRADADTTLVLPAPRGLAWRGARSSTPPSPTRRNGRSRSPTAVRSGARASLILAEAPAPRGLRGGAPSAATIEALAGAVGIAPDWWDVSGERTFVSPGKQDRAPRGARSRGGERSRGPRQPRRPSR